MADRTRTPTASRSPATAGPGTVVDEVTDPDFDVPTTIASLGSRSWVVNARFGTPPTPDTPYTLVRVG